ncbi:putative laccase [Helianthus annuus]|nr:putative laccase [Helianthus annuus]
MVSLVSLFTYVLTSLLFLCTHNTVQAIAQWPKGGSTRFYEFKVQMLQVNKLCNTRSIVTINQMYPGPVVYAQEDDRVIVKLTNETPYNATIHWHGVRQILSCWSDGPSYITQCPVQSGQTFTYEFTLIKQKGTLFWHAHFSWLRATVYGALIIYPKKGVPYPFKFPYEEHTVILGEYWQQDLVQLERSVMASGGSAPIADAYTINGHPGPNYNCSANDVYKINVVPGKTYMLRLIGALLNMESFFSIANHKLTIVEADGEYTKPFTTDRVMLGPGQTLNVLVTADQKIGSPLKFYDFVNGAPNSAPNNTGSTNGTRTKVIEYGSRVQLILQDTGTVTTENHPIHLHGYSFYVVGYGSGNYNPQTATFNLVDPPYMNTIGVPVGGWAAIRFVADNPGVWFMHCHLEIHLTWGLSVALIVKNGQGPMETLPHPPADLPHC